jgi:hypothetical protein
MKQPFKTNLKPKRMINGVFHTTLIKKTNYNRMKQPFEINLKPKRMVNGVFHTSLI